jgi:hypothetical protein
LPKLLHHRVHCDVTIGEDSKREREREGEEEGSRRPQKKSRRREKGRGQLAVLNG